MKAEKEQEAKANPAAKSEPEQMTKGAPEKVASAGQPSAEESKEESKGPQKAGPKPASSSEPAKEQEPKAL